jgi:hypothetical protein
MDMVARCFCRAAVSISTLASNGEYDGFDPWRLRSYAEGRLVEFGFSSEQEIDDLFEAAVLSGALGYSGRTLYFLRRQLSSIS